MNKDQFAFLNEEIQALTAERDALKAELQSCQSPIMGHKEKISYWENQNASALDEISRLKGFDWQNAMIELTAERDRLKAELEKANKLKELNNWHERWVQGEKEIDRLKGELEANEKEIYRLREDRDRLKGELEQYKIIDKYRTSPTPWLVAECNRWKAIAEKARGALELCLATNLVSFIHEKAEEGLAAFPSEEGKS